MNLAVIVPVHNEQDNISPFYKRASAILDTLPGLKSWSLVFVNDGSEDGSLEEILKLRTVDDRVKVITLSRRFGYHAVIVAGLSQIECDLYAVVDVDCEDPPELLAEFYTALRSDAQVAYGIRSKREEPRVITLGRKLFYQSMRRVADGETVDWMAEFSMMTRQVRDAILASRSTYPFLRAEMGYVGFKRVGVPYYRARREHGKTHYNIFRLIKFSIAAILSSSTFPLRFILYLATAIGFAFPLCVIGFGLSTRGIVTLGVLVSLYFLLVSISFISLYLARTYKNVVARPIFVIEKEQTFL
jgi:dolichol-phosphate mannosyltransferase